MLTVLTKDDLYDQHKDKEWTDLGLDHFKCTQLLDPATAIVYSDGSGKYYEYSQSLKFFAVCRDLSCLVSRHILKIAEPVNATHRQDDDTSWDVAAMFRPSMENVKNSHKTMSVIELKQFRVLFDKFNVHCAKLGWLPSKRMRKNRIYLTIMHRALHNNTVDTTVKEFYPNAVCTSFSPITGDTELGVATYRVNPDWKVT